MDQLHDTRAALVVAHPGHELRVHGWLEKARPVVYVLTDGSGRSLASRLDSTRKILSAAGAEPGAIFGRFTDVEIYSLILNGESRRFIELAAELAASLTRDRVDFVAGDASEGYNPAHDLCRLVLDAAVRIAARAAARPMRNFAFPLIGPPDDGKDPGAIRLQLDEAAFQRKIAAARGYPELQHEVDNTVGENGLEAFRRECLRPVRAEEENYIFNETPFYEKHGEKRVGAGLYSQVLRYREHMLPIADALRHHSRTTTGL